jgi:hypothetical protein
MKSPSTSTRHRWPKDGNRMAQKTERECLRGCGTIKVTLHPYGRDGNRHDVEFWRNGEKCEGTHTPICEPVTEGAGT